MDRGAWFDSLFLYSVLEAVVSPLDDGNGARARVAENCVHKLPAIRQANWHKISLVIHIISYTSRTDSSGQHQSRVTQSHQIQSHRVIWSLGFVQPDKSYPKMHHISPSAALARSLEID